MTYIIYLVKNNNNGKRYVGFTSKTIEARWKKHKHDAGIGRKTLLSNAIRKHGEQCFSIEQLTSSSDLQEARDKLEEHYIRANNSHYIDGHGYNMTYGGEGTIGHKHSDETKAKIVAKNKLRKQSDATKKKLSDQRKGSGNPNYGKSPSAQTRLKLSAATSGENNPRAKKFRVTFPDGSVKIINDRSGFCKEQGLSYFSVVSATNRGSWHCGYFFEKIKENK